MLMSEVNSELSTHSAVEGNGTGSRVSIMHSLETKYRRQIPLIKKFSGKPPLRRVRQILVACQSSPVTRQGCVRCQHVINPLDEQNYEELSRAILQATQPRHDVEDVGEEEELTSAPDS
jgi:hypothetical protein